MRNGFISHTSIFMALAKELATRRQPEQVMIAGSQIGSLQFHSLLQQEQTTDSSSIKQ